ncbi:MAG TPA: LysM peptidoglycan-binding domain-containing protein [Balneolaceae bacterium]|nr:LysM peptidoglycan-binding domain-containing protein [Balneolaceae bacterium]
MQKKLPLLIFLILAVGLSSGFAQQQKSEIKLEEVPISPKLLPYNNPMVMEDDAFVYGDQPVQHKLDEFEKEVMQKIADIYRLNVKAIEAQIRNDALGAEEYIIDALNGLQNLLDTYPEVQSDRRFGELYGSVMTEYRKFYGVTEPINQVEGDIFEIQEELFSSNINWAEKGYVLPKNITTRNMEVPLVQNEYVNNHLMYFTFKRPEVMETWLKRTERYFPMMKRIFKKVGTPVELIHLAMIESGLNPNAKSWASAVGMWQFIQATGAYYGLEVNWWVDERRDPVKATYAAARHLKDLYERWNDWHLAIAGYNISPSGLKRAIRAGGEKDYWAAFPYLPSETQGYIPGFIAATLIETNPTQFGFKEDYGIAPYEYDVFKVAPLMPLDVLADAAGITTEKLKEYNPELLRWATPPGDEYSLKLPVGTKEMLAANYDDIPKEERSQNVAMHTVHSGETLGHIARKYGTTVRALYETNEGLSSIIYPGQKIVVPLAPGNDVKIAVNRPSSSSSSSSRSEQPANTAKIYYTVKSGDTIGHIAEWYDLRSWQIRAWNHTSNLIMPGEDLVVYVPESKEAYYRQINSFSFSKKTRIEHEQRAGKNVTQIYLASVDGSGVRRYVVRSNDTLIDIANTFDTTVSRLKSLNNLSGSRIYVGQKLLINK